MLLRFTGDAENHGLLNRVQGDVLSLGLRHDDTQEVGRGRGGVGTVDDVGLELRAQLVVI